MLLKIKQIAERLACSIATVYDLIKGGKLIAVKIGARGGGIRVSEQDLQAFIESCRIVPSATPVPQKTVKLKHLR